MVEDIAARNERQPNRANGYVHARMAAVTARMAAGLGVGRVGARLAIRPSEAWIRDRSA